MRFVALATDYDGTLAHDGHAPQPVIEALTRYQTAGRRTILVTGRELPELQGIFPELELFDLVVAENGALLYFPQERREVPLVEPPPERFIEDLKRRGVSPLSVGRVIVASWESEGPKILESVQQLGLELQLIFNKGALMVLPSGTNKATGLAAALDQLGVSPHNVVAIGDAENDHAFLKYCECGVAVANALPSLKESADLVTAGDHGKGVIELIDHILRDELAAASQPLARHDILVGTEGDGTQVRIPAFGHNILVAGSSGAGKSTLTNAFCERLVECRRQFCLIDPEGDFEELGDAVVLGGPKSTPTVDEVLAVLEKPDRSVVVSLTGFGLAHRPEFFEALLPRLQQMRSVMGRPHWIIIDEAHHVMPQDRQTPPLVLPQQFTSVLMITVHPEHVSRPAIASADVLIALGKEPASAYRAWNDVLGGPGQTADPQPLEHGDALLWRAGNAEPVAFRVSPCRTERTRHNRKYAAGELPPDQSFYFSGPEQKLRLRAQNLAMFLQLAEGIDDETWLFHLRSGEYSAWFRDAIHSESLAAAAEAIERDSDLSPTESRERLREEIEREFTLSA